MRKVFIGLFLTFIIFFGVFLALRNGARPTLARSETVADPLQRGPNKHAVCLKTIYCKDEACIKEYQNGAPVYYNLEDDDDEDYADHRSQLEVDPNNKPLPNSNTYITECINANNEGYICTTGSSGLDREFFDGQDNYGTLRSKINGYGVDPAHVPDNDDDTCGPDEEGVSSGERFAPDGYGIFKLINNTKTKVGPQKYMSDATGNLPFEKLQWRSYSCKKMGRLFYAWNVATPTPTPTAQPTVPTSTPLPGQFGNTGNDNGLKQGNLDFPLPTATTTPTPTPPPGIVTNCTIVYFDPEGRVFDAVSLEPIAGAKVSLLKKYVKNEFGVKCSKANNDPAKCEFRKAIESELGISDPFITDASTPGTATGRYGFFVDNDSYYKLNVSAANYTFPVTDIAKVNPKYRMTDDAGVQMYSEIYPAQTGDEVYQEKLVVHRDIPLMPNKAEGYTTPLKVINSFEYTNDNGEWVAQGELTHPLSTVRVYARTLDGKKGTLIRTVRADRNGRYLIKINQNSIAPNMLGILEYEKPAVTTTPSTDTTRVTSRQVEPMPTYLEGFAYDETGKIIANARVGLYVSMFKTPYYETVTYSDGSFRIPTDYLPKLMPFTIKFTDPTGKENTVKTSAFLAAIANQQPVSTTSKYNPYANMSVDTVLAMNKTEGKTVADTENYYKGSEFFSTVQANQAGNQNISPSSAVNKKTQTTPNNMILIAVILLLLLGAIGVMLAVYIYKKNSTALPQ